MRMLRKMLEKRKTFELGMLKDAFERKVEICLLCEIL